VRLHAIYQHPDLHMPLQTISYDRTVVIDTSGKTEDAILATMPKSGRRSIRSGLKKGKAEGVTFHEDTAHAASVIDEYYAVMEETARRDGFRPHPKAVYMDLLSTLGAEVVLVAPPTLLPMGVENWPVRTSYTMDSEIADADAVMMLRVQQERMHGGFFPTQREYATLYGMSKERLARIPEHAMVMHPGPMLRGMEINYEVADAPQTAVLQQVSNGVHVRMAVLFTLLVGTDNA